ncbi:serpentine type 7TM GPCR chemoreceptor srbc domain-containing protein [Ditylenchus destructor]|nr:serpentine type 7TM GPCR chemoreceptor srbc domain-containing protein [Ditylenchus destructor]
MAVSPWVILVQYIAGVIANSISLFFIFRILKRAYRAGKNVTQNISLSLLVYFIFWFLNLLVSFPSNLYVIVMHITICVQQLVTWSPYGMFLLDIKSNPYITFWIGLLSLQMFLCTPIVVLCVTLERLIYLNYSLIYDSCKSMVLICTTITIIISMIIAGVIAACQELPLAPQTENCTVLACLFVKTGAAFFTYTKICLGFANVITGSLFLFKFRQAKCILKPLQAKHSASRRINKMAVLVICLEFFFNFLPQLTALILFQIFGIMLGSIVGSYNLMGSLDALISSIMYSAILNREKSKERKEIPLTKGINAISVKTINLEPQAIDLTQKIA